MTVSATTEIMNLKKSQLLVVIHFICLNNLKFVGGRKSNFSLKYLCCRPLDSAAWGSRTTAPSYATDHKS
jgi:hypothetical protein